MEKAILIGINCIHTEIENILVDVYSTERNYICVKKCDLSSKQAIGMFNHGSRFSYSIIGDDREDKKIKEFVPTLLITDYIEFLKHYTVKLGVD